MTGCDANHQIVKDMSKHTPGPWKVHEDGRSIYTDHTNPAGMFSIAQGFPGNPEAMDRANLTLAAQAPDLKQQRDDLLAALNGIIDLASNEADALSDLPESEHYEDAEEAQTNVAKAREVIARVEGKQ